MTLSRALHGVLALVLAGCARVAVEQVVPNDNRAAAGVLRDGVLSVHLEAREGRWFPDGSAGPGSVMPMFGEAGGPLRNPGPLIRVPAGTAIRATVHNTLGDTLVVKGFATRPGALDDSLAVPPGATREVSFDAGAPGTYFYWGTTTHESIDARSGMDSQLHGAFVVDTAGTPPDRDRVFVLGSWTGPEDHGRGHVARDPEPAVRAERAGLHGIWYGGPYCSRPWPRSRLRSRRRARHGWIR